MSTPDEIAAAAAVLREGGLVAFPTETVYGLGADARNPVAVERLYAVKGRPAWHPVIVHLGDASQLHTYGVDVPDWANALAATFWPGPLTLIVHRAPGVVCDAATGGLNTVGLRVPYQPVALELLRAFGGGVAAPSANRFGRVSPTSADDVRHDLGADVDVILDGGPCMVGVESTIVDCTSGRARVLRLGGITVAELTHALGEAPEVVQRDASEGDAIEGVRAPGTIASHYAPRAEVVLVNADAIVVRAQALLEAGVAVGVLTMGDVALTDVPAALEVLDQPATVAEYAQVLYQRLRDADRRELGVLLVVAPEDEGLGAAVVDRLRRAAADA